MNSITINNVVFQYILRRSSLACDENRYYCVVNAPQHDIYMGEVIWFGATEPKKEFIIWRVKRIAKILLSNNRK